jgi:ribonuclease D
MGDDPLSPLPAVPDDAEDLLLDDAPELAELDAPIDEAEEAPLEARLVETAADLELLVEELSGAEQYAVDTEFHRERTYFARLALVQLAWDGKIAIVDPLAIDVSPLRRVFESDGLAIFHAADQDLEILDRVCGAAPRRMFDTQVSSGFIGFSTPSLVHLTERLLGRRLQKGDQLADWTRRPLPAAQLQYAAGDVAYLVELRAEIVTRLTKLGREEWAAEECALALARDRAPGVPEEAWWRIRHARQLRGSARGVAQCVTAWRERRARERDVPVRFVLPDLALIAIAQRPPRTRAELEMVRSIDGRHLGAGAAEELLEAVEQGLRMGPDELHLPPVDHVEHVVRPAVSIAAAWVAQRAAELGIDPAILGSRGDIVGFLQRRPGGRLSSGWRHELVGEPLRRLATGRASIAFDGRGDLVLEERSRRSLVMDGPPPEAEAGDGEASATSPA